ncbi:MAG TPA: cytochrome c [Blastocatellia bacterium]|nr:cytochrome c [Blastocatellia bacterium]
MKRTLSLSLATIAVLLFAAATSFDTASAYGPAPVTFSKDIAPIFFSKCAACHRPGEIAPMSLLSYKEARPWARSIKEKVVNRVMPPWHADPHVGDFRNDRRLSDKEIATISAWVDNGAPEGNPRDLPPTPRFTNGWQIGQPDVVLSMPTEYSVPAEGTVSYQYFSVPTGFTEDKWIQAAEVRPGNRGVVHHVIVFVVGPEAARQRMGAFRGEGGFEGLVGTAPGEEPMVLPDGIGKLIKAGSVLMLQMHYTPNGKATTDRTSIGLRFSRKPVQQALAGGAAMNHRFEIPAGSDNYEVKSVYAFKADSHIHNLMPHMHLRGKDFEYQLVYPDGTAKTILRVPRYDFNWQTRYEFKEPVAAPRGSRLECVAHFDNSTKNKWNPDATKVVRWGQQTWEEMMIGFVGFTLDEPAAQAASK